MKEFFCPALELMVLLPGILLAYLPMKQHLKIRPLRLAGLTIPLLLLLCAVGGGICCFFSVNPRWLFLPVAAVAGFFYVHTLKITLWKSISVFLAVCAAFSCLRGTATAIDSILNPGNTGLMLSPNAILAWNLMCWLFTFLAWYPATHAARELLEDNAFAPTWYVFWILPLLFIGLNQFLIPVYPGILQQGRMIEIYIVISLALLFLLLLFYGLFYLMASSLNKNDLLRQENQFLSMQQARYDNLRAAIEETREARHDMRHHFDTLLSLTNRKEWNKLTKYLSDARGEIPDMELHLCNNAAADGVAGHYGLLCHKHDIPFSVQLDLPEILPVPEIDLCLVLSNLLENALEASLKTEPAKRNIQVQAYLHSGHMVLLTVENAFNGKIKESGGIFQSSKRQGDGVGIQSIRRIAEKNGGYSRFFYEDGVFRANVMLRGE